MFAEVPSVPEAETVQLDAQLTAAAPTSEASIDTAALEELPKPTTRLAEKENNLDLPLEHSSIKKDAVARVKGTDLEDLVGDVKLRPQQFSENPRIPVFEQTVKVQAQPL